MSAVDLRGCALAAPILFAALSCAASASHAQEGGTRGTLSSASVAGTARLDADIDGGGAFSANGVVAKGTIGRTLGPGWTGAVTVSYAYEDWSFATPDAFGSAGPWDSINAPSIGANLRYRYSDQVFLFVSPQVAWTYESGAIASDGLSYGAAFGATYAYSRTLSVGLGAAAFRQVNRTQVLPFVIVEWQINDKLVLSNPLEAGPTGGPGIELSYALDDRWDAGIGVAFRNTRFRLKSDGGWPNGIGEDKGVPVFAHVTFSPTRAVTVDLYAGAIVNGRLKVLDSNGSTVTSSDYHAQPVLGVRAAYAF
jgi:hypothetical protein